MFSKFSVVVLQLILCTFRGADQDHFAEIAKAISSETGINESEVLDLFAKANALEKRLESVEKTKQMLKLDQSIQQDRDDHQEEEGGEDRAGGTEGGEGVDAPRQERVPLSAQDPVIKTAGDPVIKAAGDPVIKTAGDPVVKTAGDPVVKAAGDPVVKTAGDPVVKAAGDPSLTIVTQVEEPGNVSQAGPEGKTRETGEGDGNGKSNTPVFKKKGSQSPLGKSENLNVSDGTEKLTEVQQQSAAVKNPDVEQPPERVKLCPEVRPRNRFSNINDQNIPELYLAALENKKIAESPVNSKPGVTVVSLEADLRVDDDPRRRTVIRARRLAGSNKKRRASRVELLVQFLSSRAEKDVENLKRYFGKNFEKVTALNFKKFRSDVLKAEKQINDTETVLKLHGTVVSKTEDVKKSNSTALGLGLGLGLGLPALIAVVFCFLVKTNRLLLNFGFSSDNFADNGSMV